MNTISVLSLAPTDARYAWRNGGGGEQLEDELPTVTTLSVAPLVDR